MSKSLLPIDLMFSPHTWGCTYSARRLRNQRKVFPTHVGVYLGVGTCEKLPKGFPHTRGGVPRFGPRLLRAPAFSPHTWGCTEHPAEEDLFKPVFPTHVGVYLNYVVCRWRRIRFPHVRGGVPVVGGKNDGNM